MGLVMFRLIVTLLLAVAVSACASLGMRRPVAEEDLGKTQRVGVVSMLGDTFYGISKGTTVFNNDGFTASVPDWNVDKQSAATALNLLRSNARFESAALDRTGLSVAQLQADDAKALWQAAQAQQFGRLVVILPGVSDNFRLFHPGYGLYERSLLGYSKRCIYAGYVVNVYDVATRKVIGWEWGGESPCQLGSDNDLPFKARFEDYSPHEQQVMRKRLEARMATTLNGALGQLSLLAPAAAAK